MGHDLDDQELEATRKKFYDKPKNIDYELSEEEKKALEVLNNKVEYINNMPINTRDERTIRFAIEVQKVANEIIDIANEVIYKQQKKIEKLKDKCKELIIEKQQLTSALLDSTPNDEIREKIEDLKSLSKNITMQPSIYNYEIDLLEELLEEK